MNILIFIELLRKLAGSGELERKFKNYSQIPLPSGMTGVDVARKMLRETHQRCRNFTPGMLTDHFNPLNKPSI